MWRGQTKEVAKSKNKIQKEDKRNNYRQSAKITHYKSLS